MLQSILVSAIPIALMAAKPAFAACEGGHTYGFCEDRIVHWYDPNTGEICSPLDCGGGRAPVKYDVPGCAAYTGTEVYDPKPSFMPCFEQLRGSATIIPTLVTSATVSEVVPTSEPGSTEPSEPTSAKTSSAQSEPTSSQPVESESEPAASSTEVSSKASSSHSVTVPVTTPATTPAPTKSSSTQTSSSVSSTPPAEDPNSGAAGLHGSVLLAAVAGMLALAI